MDPSYPEARVPAEFEDLFHGVAVAQLATLRADGTPRLTPVWLDLDEDVGQQFSTPLEIDRSRHAAERASGRSAGELVLLDQEQVRLALFGQVVCDGRADNAPPMTTVLKRSISSTSRLAAGPGAGGRQKRREVCRPRQRPGRGRTAGRQQMAALAGGD